MGQAELCAGWEYELRVAGTGMVQEARGGRRAGGRRTRASHGRHGRGTGGEIWVCGTRSRRRTDSVRPVHFRAGPPTRDARNFATTETGVCLRKTLRDACRTHHPRSVLCHPVTPAPTLQSRSPIWPIPWMAPSIFRLFFSGLQQRIVVVHRPP